MCRIGIANLDDVEDGGKDVEIPGPGDYEISWRKWVSLIVMLLDVSN